MIPLILSTVCCLLLTPIILTVVLFLAILAVITSTLTSSFIFLRLTLLTIEMVSGLTLESTNWLLSTFMSRIRIFLCHRNKQPQTNDVLLKRRKLAPSSLSLSKLPYKAQVKSKYSVSVPGTPDPESYHHQMGI
ncbi:uncharacterized protein EV154DRAFT_499145 [Mucor mucedo]|nr:uncharacterized protein EV154DRAFT_499145 [Mucor mucedo]KAI7894292.1 hypothetical protein EV154DRAFT_499145 [Mucor mucedo]